VRDEHVALLRRQLRKRALELVEQDAARVLFFRSGVADGRRSSRFKCSDDTSGRLARNRSVMRLRATRNSQPVTCSIGINRRFASTSV